jgi:hypothetical protein
LITRVRWPAFAVDARSKVTVALCEVALLMRIFETPVDGLTLICDAGTCDRSKKPEELIVKFGEVPTVTVFGVMGWACATETNRVTKAVAMRATIERGIARWVMIAAFLELRTRGMAVAPVERCSLKPAFFNEMHVQMERVTKVVVWQVNRLTSPANWACK